jgi:hypothetical protein
MARKKAERGWPLGPVWCYAAVSRLLNWMTLVLRYECVKGTYEADASAEEVLQ